jgi:hypothetical protein
MGTKTFAETLAIWKSSSGHNANLLKPNVTRIGLASASRDGTTYWALILAAQPKPPQPKARSATFVCFLFFCPSYCSELERPEPLLISLGDEVADEG